MWRCLLRLQMEEIAWGGWWAPDTPGLPPRLAVINIQRRPLDPSRDLGQHAPTCIWGRFSFFISLGSDGRRSLQDGHDEDEGKMKRMVLKTFSFIFWQVTLPFLGAVVYGG